jgi:nucleotide-binding universal stress UspA family protein
LQFHFRQLLSWAEPSKTLLMWLNSPSSTTPTFSAGINESAEGVMYKHILIPTDGSTLSSKALDQSLAFAKEAGAKVTVLMATEPFHLFAIVPDQIAATRGEYEREALAHAVRHLAAAEQKSRSLGVSCDTLVVENAHPYDAIITTAVEKGCDLIAMASHGRRGVSAIVLGSETLKVLTHSRTPILIYR